MRMNGKKDGVLMACYACLLVIGGLLTWLKYDYNAVKMEDVREACGYVSASATPVEAPKIALTFDDGPSAAWTPALLDGLKERGVKATFFLIGENADKNPEIVKRMAEEGHLIGNHTYHHVELTKVSENEARSICARRLAHGSENWNRRSGCSRCFGPLIRWTGQRRIQMRS